MVDVNWCKLFCDLEYKDKINDINLKEVHRLRMQFLFVFFRPDLGT